ncbi:MULTISPECIES: hypothetical protein [Ruminococcus]|nr:MULTISPECIES: hypothetical protein [Ruminococcus]
MNLTQERYQAAKYREDCAEEQERTELENTSLSQTRRIDRNSTVVGQK